MEELKYKRFTRVGKDLWEWQDVDLKDIKDGDIFRGMKSDGSFIKNSTGNENLIADGNAYIDEEEGNWVICIS